MPDYTAKLKEIDENLERYTDPANQARFKESDLLEDVQKMVEKLSDQKGAILLQNIRSGETLSFEQTEFLQRYAADIGVERGEIKNLSEEERTIPVLKVFTSMLLNSDGKLSESEVQVARQQARIAIEDIQKVVLGEMPEADALAALEEQLEGLKTQRDATALMELYINAYNERSVASAGKLTLEEWKNIDDIIAQPMNEDKNVQEALKNLDQARLVDDMQPYGDVASKTPEAKTAEEPAAKAAVQK